jgi:hypothetical protein
MNKTELREREAVKSKLVSDYMDAKQEVKKYTSIVENLKQKLDLNMTQNNTNMIFFGSDYVESVPNPSVTVDVKQFKRLVSDAEFAKSVTVPVGKARLILSEVQMKKVCKVKPDTKLITGTIE